MKLMPAGQIQQGGDTAGQNGRDDPNRRLTLADEKPDKHRRQRVIKAKRLDVTYQSFITKKDIQALRESIHPDHRSLIEMLYVYIDGYQQRTFLEGSPLHDSVAVAALVHPEIFTTREAYVEVDYSESYTRGTTLVDGLNNLKLNSNATILETIDREAFLRMTLRSFERFKHA